jgi:enoyl-CoA hydratase
MDKYRENIMQQRVNYAFRDDIATIQMDDGKANAISCAMIDALNRALDQAEKDKAICIITGRAEIFSAGFDLAELGGSPEQLCALLIAGSKLCTRLLDFPFPVIAACNGHAYPMGAFIMLSCDYRIGSSGQFNIGMNEVAIGIAAPQYAMELARARLLPPYFQRTAILGELFDPATAATAGFLDEVCAQSALLQRAEEKARQLLSIDFPSMRTSKQRVRHGLIETMQTVTERDITLEKARQLLGQS